MVFTFHHSRQSHWADLIEVLLQANFALTATYPVYSEGTKSGNLVFHSNTNNIAYDIIHLCEKIPAYSDERLGKIEWNELRTKILRKVKNYVAEIANGNEHGQKLAEADIKIMLWSESLALYSQHFGHCPVSCGFL